MTVLEYDGRLLVIDCGVLFPEDNQPGVDLILPDFDSIRGPARRRRGDRPDPRPRGPHRRGAVPAAREAGHPAGRLAGSRWRCVEAKLQEHRIKPYTLDGPEGERERLGPFDCEFVAVNHSIPDALAVAVRTAGGPGAAHRRLQDGPAAARRPAHRPAGVRPARRGGRRPLPGRLDQRRGARLHHPRARHRARCSTGCSRQRQRRIIVACFASPRAPRAAGARRRRHGTAARSPSSAARWCATWASPATSATCASRRACWSTCETLDDLPRRRGRAHLAPARRASRCRRCRGSPTATTAIRIEPGRHRGPGLVADPRQRERRLPRDQRADPVGRHGRAQGQRAGARLRSRQRRRAALLLQHRAARATSCRCTARCATCAPTPTWPCSPACRARPGRARRGRRRRRPRRRPGRASSARCPAATSTSTARASATSPSPSLKDRRILGDEGFISVVVVVDSVTGKVAGGPEIHARGFAEDDAVFDERPPADRGGARAAPREGIGDTDQLQQIVRRTVGAGSATPTAAGR